MIPCFFQTDTRLSSIESQSQPKKAVVVFVVGLVVVVVGFVIIVGL